MKLFTTDRNSHAVVRKAGIEPEDEDVKRQQPISIVLWVIKLLLTQ